MPKTAFILVALFGALVSVAGLPAHAGAGIDFSSNAPTTTDEAAIAKLLAAYTTAVSDGDEVSFKRLLLNERIPFTGVESKITSESNQPFGDQNFADFDREIFKSGLKYQQSFYNIHTLQDGSLAQVSLDFVTKQVGTGRAGWGWKILQLVKVDGDWKIASEFFTGHPLPQTKRR